MERQVINIQKAVLDLGEDTLDEFMSKLNDAVKSAYSSADPWDVWIRVIRGDWLVASVWSDGGGVKLMRHSYKREADSFKLGAGEAVREVVSYVLE